MRSAYSVCVSLRTVSQPISVEHVPLLSGALPSASLASGQAARTGEPLWFALETMISPLRCCSEVKLINEVHVPRKQCFLTKRHPDMLSCEVTSLISYQMPPMRRHRHCTRLKVDSFFDDYMGTKERIVSMWSTPAWVSRLMLRHLVFLLDERHETPYGHPLLARVGSVTRMSHIKQCCVSVWGSPSHA